MRYTEYGDEAFGEPDEHLAAAPTYEDETILQWLLAQEPELGPAFRRPSQRQRYASREEIA